MSEILLSNGKRVFYEYDAVQDMLYVLFREKIGPTHYMDAPNLAGVMLRYDNVTDEVVGITVHNVQRKLLQRLVVEIGDEVLAVAA